MNRPTSETSNDPSTSSGSPRAQSRGDVRMRGFARRHTVAAALEWLDGRLRPFDVAEGTPLGVETVPLGLAAGRVLASPVVSDVDVPGFDRATMDGYAVEAASTDGAGSYNRLALTVIGDSMPGRPFDGSVRPGEAVRVMTGAPIPRGADAVLPAELVDIGDQFEASVSGSPAEAGLHIQALAAVSPGKNVGRRGEDIRRGAAVLEPGRVLRPQDIGVLSSNGHGQV